jgi:hypothetical protein
MKWMRRGIVTLLVAGALSLSLVGPAAAQPVEQDGLVNVFVGDDVVAACVPITVAVDAVVTVCNLDVTAVVGVLAQIRAVDRTGRERQFCTVDDEPVTVTNPTTCPN